MVDGGEMILDHLATLRSFGFGNQSNSRTFWVNLLDAITRIYITWMHSLFPPVWRTRACTNESFFLYNVLYFMNSCCLLNI